jgi:hypothetical protein
MKYTYELITSELGGEILRRVDEQGKETWIPIDEANSDYQRYLNPEAEQSTPIVIDETEAK